ncbi:MAG: LacI family transcriptional regulator [Defluviitaleaceae bacterium]|nr:LacI family transcriptional regulator [Defluviitaleaceae bacterium]
MTSVKTTSVKMTSVELAKLAGVSQGTVSRCLNDSPLVSEVTKQRVKKLAEEHNFHLNSNARSLRSDRSNTIGYVFPENVRNLTNYFMQNQLYFYIHEHLQLQGLDLIPIFPDKRPEVSSYAERLIRGRKIDGIIVSSNEPQQHVLDLIEATELPCIFSYVTSPKKEGYSTIISNMHENGYSVGKAFCESGYSNFIEMHAFKGRGDSVQKHEGFAEALESYGKHIEEENQLDGDLTFETAYRVTLENLDKFRQADACFAHNDAMALAIIEVLSENGIRIPEDMVLVGCGNITMSSWFRPRLSTIAVDYGRISELCAKWMIDLMQNGETQAKTETITGTLLRRETF